MHRLRAFPDDVAYMFADREVVRNIVTPSILMEVTRAISGNAAGRSYSLEACACCWKILLQEILLY